MPEKTSPAMVVWLAYDCDECGEPMEFTGVVLPSNPALFAHECKSGHRANLSRPYPQPDFREVKA